jgi:hypothetical protein
VKCSRKTVLPGTSVVANTRKYPKYFRYVTTVRGLHPPFSAEVGAEVLEKAG